MSQPIDWRTALQEWLDNNSKIMPEDLSELREEFLRRFPKEKISELTLEQYALGHDGYKDSFCYWLEWETRMLGSVSGGSVAKWGVWFSSKNKTWTHNKVYATSQEALREIKDGLTAIVAAVDEGDFDQLDTIGDKQLGRNRNSLRAKPLYLYYPEQFLPISNPVHLANMLQHFGLEPTKGLHSRNRQLLTHLHSLPEFDGFDTLQIMRFLYAYNLHEKAVVFQNQVALQAAIKGFVRFANSPYYHRREYDYKQDLLHSLQGELEGIKEGDAETSVLALQQWAAEQHNALNNLTSWQESDNFLKYLSGVPAAQIQSHLQALLDEDGDLSERIDSFRLAVEAEFETYLKQKRTLNLGFISILLMGSDWEQYIIYRANVIDKACTDWDAPKITSGKQNAGEKYTLYLALIPPLQSQLTKALNRSADLIDVHSFLWFNHTDEYDEFKQDVNKQTTAVEERPFMRHLIQVAKRTRNIILYGPPGTGKTYWARQFGQRFETQHIYFVTFHQSFAYEDFVEGLKPQTTNGQVQYHIVPGVFRRVCRLAQEDPNHEYLLVIDEINRANIAKVFGELITLIEDDKRLGQENELTTVLPYSGDAFGVPANLYIFGTMNTADRSIALLDIALRRRFTFTEVMPNLDLLHANRINDLSLGLLLQQLNERVTVLLDKDHQIGHSYFLNIESLADLRFAWEHRIIPLLQEYFYNDGERLQAVLGKQFILRRKSSSATQKALGHWYDTDTPQYQLADLSDEAFMNALKALGNDDTD